MNSPTHVGARLLVVGLVLLAAACDNDGRRILGLGPAPTPTPTPTPAGPTLEVTTSPTNTGAYEPIPLAVTVRDANGDPVAGASVTVALEANPGAMIFWGAGTDDFFQLVDPIGATNADFLGVAGANSDEPALTYDPEQGLVLMYDRSDYFGTVDPVTGVYTELGSNNHIGSDEPRQMAFDPTGRLFLVDSDDDRLFEVDKTDGTEVDLGSVTNLTDGDTVALATDPTTGTMYVGADNDVGSDRGLLTLDVGTLTATYIGDFGPSNVNGLAFFPDGDLYASTGEDDSDEYECFTVDVATGALGASLVAVGNNPDGCSLCTIPARLRGTLTVTSDANGVATFTDLILDGVASGYTLRITSPGFPDVVTNAFDVMAPDLSGVVEFASPASTVAESSGQVSVQVTVTPPQNHPIFFYFWLSGSADIPREQAIANSGDFDLPQVGNVGAESQTAVVIPPNTSTFDLLVNLIDDGVGEGDETLVFTLGALGFPAKVGLGTAGATTVHTMTIQENPL